MYSKQELRKKVTLLLENQKLVPDFTTSCTALLKLQEYSTSHIIAGYIPFKTEASPIPFFTSAFNENKMIAFPKINAETMDFYNCNNHTNFEKNIFGIFEPQNETISDFSKNTLFIVPGLAFTKDGKRMGRGKGYYDKFFAMLFSQFSQSKYTLIGFCNSMQLVDDIPTNPHDIIMNYIATEQGIIKCKN